METYLVLILLTSNIITEVNMVQFYSYFLKLKIELVSLQTCVNIHTDYNFEERHFKSYPYFSKYWFKHQI